MPGSLLPYHIGRKNRTNPYVELLTLSSLIYVVYALKARIILGGDPQLLPELSGPEGSERPTSRAKEFWSLPRFRD